LKAEWLFDRCPGSVGKRLGLLNMLLEYYDHWGLTEVTTDHSDHHWLVRVGA